MTSFSDLLEEFQEARRNAYVDAITLNYGGRHVAGVFGKNIPREILWALDITPINVYSIDGSNIAASKENIEAEKCSLVKASYGYTVTERCPLIYSSHIIIINDMCPHKSSMISKLNGIKDSFIIKEHKSIEDQVLEYEKLVEYLEKKFNKKLNNQKLYEVMDKINNINEVTKKINDLYMSRKYPLTAYDLFCIIYGSQFILDLNDRYNKLSQIYNLLKSLNLENISDENNKTKIILITGAPLAGLMEEILKPLSLIKDIFVVLPASICEGENYELIMYGENPYRDLAEKYINDNSFMKENYDGVDAIIDVNLSGCDVLPKHNKHIPYLSLTVDYDSDSEKIYKALHSFI